MMFLPYLWIGPFFDYLKLTIENPIRNAIITIFYNKNRTHSYNRRNRACKFLPVCRKQTDYGWQVDWKNKVCRNLVFSISLRIKLGDFATLHVKRGVVCEFFIF